MAATSDRPPRPRVRLLQPKRLGKTTAAVAGLASALSVIIGFIASRSAPHGFMRLAVTLHLRHEPFIVKLAATVAGIAVLAATVSGVLHFYTWWQERDADDGAG